MTTRKILLIDGNNLAHYLYHDLQPHQKLQLAHYYRLCDQLISYCMTFAGAVEMEICFDRSPFQDEVKTRQTAHMRIYFPDPNRDADTLLLSRLDYYLFGSPPRKCLVVTNDERLCERIIAHHGTVLKIFTFVRRPGISNPVFLSPAELPTVHSPKEMVQHLAEDGLHFRVRIASPQPRRRLANVSIPRHSPETDSPIGQARSQTELPAQQASSTQPAPEAIEPVTRPDAPEQPWYALTMENWPAAEGCRFLARSFCGKHHQEHQPFIEELVAAQSLADLSELLLHTCGREEEFCRHGALLARVRLALLQARGQPLSLSELAERTGLKLFGLQGRIRQKSAAWLAIYCRKP